MEILCCSVRVIAGCGRCACRESDKWRPRRLPVSVPLVLSTGALRRCHIASLFLLVVVTTGGGLGYVLVRDRVGVDDRQRRIVARDIELVAEVLHRRVERRLAREAQAPVLPRAVVRDTDSDLDPALVVEVLKDDHGVGLEPAVLFGGEPLVEQLLQLIELGERRIPGDLHLEVLEHVGAATDVGAGQG